MTLIDRLQRLAQLWATAQGKELSTLGTLVAKDGKFFARLEEGKTCTVATLERFLVFFRDRTNWPDSAIPDPGAELLADIQSVATASEVALGSAQQSETPVDHARQDTAVSAVASAGNGSQISAAIAVCPVCDLRPEDPAARACTASDCGLALRPAA